MADEEGNVTDVEQLAQDIHLSEARDKDWHKDAKTALKTFRNERKMAGSDERKRDVFNILWSNVETVRPALYSQTPKPDIRKRFVSSNPIGRHVSSILEKSSTYCLTEYGMHDAMISAVNDMLLPGRGVTRLSYIPTIVENETEEGEIEETIEKEEVGFESWQWDQILLGPGEKWEDLPWIAFIHKFSKKELRKIAPDFADKISYDVASSGEDGDKKEARTVSRATVYEVWMKETREVKWYCPGYPDDFIKVDEDPLNLENFWPIPRPLYSIESTTSMIPVTEFSQYETLAANLEDATVRMGRITKALRVRGIYDSTMAELNKLFEAGDNQMIPAENLSRLMESGGLEKAIWMFPNETLVNVLLQLYQYREQTIAQIYEITGISDIMRGSSNPYETLGAQKIKGNFGSQRLQKRQAEVQRYAKDILKIVVEIIAEKFSTETLSKITGLEYPSRMEQQQAKLQMQFAQQQAQQAAQQAQQTGQQPPEPPKPPPEMLEMLQKPSWEDLKEAMEQDVLRNYLVDIETDSTIQADQQADQEALTLLLQGIGQFTQNMAPAIQSGVLDTESGKKLLVGILRRFRLGREVEEAIESSQNAQPDAEQQAAQQAEQQKQQAEMQQLQAKVEADKQEMQLKMQEMQMEMQQSKADHEQKMQAINMQMQRDREKHQFEMARFAAQKQAIGAK